MEPVPPKSISMVCMPTRLCEPSAVASAPVDSAVVLKLPKAVPRTVPSLAPLRSAFTMPLMLERPEVASAVPSTDSAETSAEA